MHMLNILFKTSFIFSLSNTEVGSLPRNEKPMLPSPVSIPTDWITSLSRLKDFYPLLSLAVLSECCHHVNWLSFHFFTRQNIKCATKVPVLLVCETLTLPARWICQKRKLELHLQIQVKIGFLLVFEIRKGNGVILTSCLLWVISSINIFSFNTQNILWTSDIWGRPSIHADLCYQFFNHWKSSHC